MQHLSQSDSLQGLGSTMTPSQCARDDTQTPARRCIKLRHTLRNTNKFGSTCAQEDAQRHTRTHARLQSHKHTHTYIKSICDVDIIPDKLNLGILLDSINTYKTSRAIKTSSIHSKSGVTETNTCLCHAKEAVQLPRCKQKYS